MPLLNKSLDCYFPLHKEPNPFLKIALKSAPILGFLLTDLLTNWVTWGVMGRHDDLNFALFQIQNGAMRHGKTLIGMALSGLRNRCSPPELRWL